MLKRVISKFLFLKFKTLPIFVFFLKLRKNLIGRKFSLVRKLRLSTRHKILLEWASKLFWHISEFLLQNFSVSMTHFSIRNLKRTNRSSRKLVQTRPDTHKNGFTSEPDWCLTNPCPTRPNSERRVRKPNVTKFCQKETRLSRTQTEKTRLSSNKQTHFHF